MITIVKQVTADNTDMLDGTDLDAIPSDGVMEFYFASTVADTTFTIRGQEDAPVASAQRMQLRANAAISLVDDIPLSLGVGSKEKVKVEVDVVTAATVTMIAVFTPLEEL